jgi:hypothetical protein
MLRTVSRRLGVTLKAHEVQQHAGLSADDPSVVAGRHVEGVARAELALGAVIELQPYGLEAPTSANRVRTFRGPPRAH